MKRKEVLATEFEPGRQYRGKLSYTTIYTCKMVKGRLKLVYEHKGLKDLSIDVKRDGIKPDFFLEVQNDKV